MNEMMTAEAYEKGRLLNKAIKIIKELSKNTLADIDGPLGDSQDESVESVKGLILKARAITTDR